MCDRICAGTKDAIFPENLEAICGMSKAEAVSDDGVMMLASYAIIVNMNTGAVVSCEVAP